MKTCSCLPPWVTFVSAVAVGLFMALAFLNIGKNTVRAEAIKNNKAHWELKVDPDSPIYTETIFTWNTNK